MFFTICVTIVGDFSVLNGPKCSTKMLPSVSKHKKAMICLIEKMCMIDELSSGTSYSAVGCELKVSESTTYIK